MADAPSRLHSGESGFAAARLHVGLFPGRQSLWSAPRRATALGIFPAGYSKLRLAPGKASRGHNCIPVPRSSPNPVIQAWLLRAALSAVAAARTSAFLSAGRLL